MTTVTREVYAALKDRSDRYEASRRSLFPNRCSFSRDDINAIIAHAGIDREPTNAERGQIEVFEWNDNPPDAYFAYVNVKDRTCTTWEGSVLGTVGFGDEFRDNFGGVRVPINVYATNGKTYYGIYYKSAGDYCRLKAKKAA